MTTAATQRSRHRKEAGFFQRIALPLALALAAIVVLLYPVVVTQLNNIAQREAAAYYSQFETQTGDDVLSERLESAHRYNQMRATGPILDPWLARISEDNGDYQAYLEELNFDGMMGRLVLPTAKVDLPVYHGTSVETLERGVGHLFGSDLPVGGIGTHTVLTAHTGLPNATLFDNLTDVKEGDAIYIATAGQKLKYEVFSTEVVLPNETDSLSVQDGQDLMTLITCTPYGINTHRLLVHARQVELDAQEVEEVFDNTNLTWQWWMYALIAASILILILAAWWAYAMYKKFNTRQNLQDENDVNES